MMISGNTIPAVDEVQFVRLPDGRRLAYSESGDAAGKPVLYCHGHPGSRLDEAMFGSDSLGRCGVRMISIDRPGVGQSDFQPRRRIMDWPADVRALADALELPRFAVFGVSGGGPFAAACAQALPERVSKALLVSSVGRFDLPGITQGMGPGLTYFRLGRYAPLLCRLMLRMMAGGLKAGPDKMAAQVKSGMPAADIAAFEQPGVMDGFIATLAEFLRQPPGNMAWEAGLYMRPWGIPLETIRVPVHLWHGEADRNAPIAMGRDLAARIPGCTARYIPGEGHFSLFVNHMAEIMETLREGA